MPGSKAVVTREELALALAIMREHSSVCLRIFMARTRGDDRAAEVLARRLAHLDDQLERRWGLQNDGGGVH